MYGNYWAVTERSRCPGFSRVSRRPVFGRHSLLVPTSFVLSWQRPQHFTDTVHCPGASVRVRHSSSLTPPPRNLIRAALVDNKRIPGTNMYEYSPLFSRTYNVDTPIGTMVDTVRRNRILPTTPGPLRGRINLPMPERSATPLRAGLVSTESGVGSRSKSQIK
ncbi:hypothetical protein K438DRAFT_1767333 [Mycena galopus ATCC 62051]|nr:hypothetical protein K438DRAFT_1767333 [Mycena galopus ATCC 62051]